MIVAPTGCLNCERRCVTLSMSTKMTAVYPDDVQNRSQRTSHTPTRPGRTNEEFDRARSSMPQASFRTGDQLGRDLHTELETPRRGTGEDRRQTVGSPPAGASPDPMGLPCTVDSDTASIPEPVLDAFSSERKQALGIPAGTPSTKMYPIGTRPGHSPRGGADDRHRGSGHDGGGGRRRHHLSPASDEEQIAGIMGFGTPVPVAPTAAC